MTPLLSIFSDGAEKVLDVSQATYGIIQQSGFHGEENAEKVQEIQPLRSDA